MPRTYTVSQVARMARVTVRTLHHYDELGLLVPSDRSEAGYRLYRDEDLARLREILLLRELGFGLDAVAALVDQPVTERREALRAQRERLVAERSRMDAVIRAVDAQLDAIDGGTTMPTEAMFEGFDHFAHAEEAERRWGDTPQYAESQRRTKTYTKDDWARYQAEAADVLAAFARLADSGAPADGEAAIELAERHRLLIDRWFYPCDRAMHAQLAVMYTDDPRFAAHYDRARPGLSAYVRTAIEAAREVMG